MNLKKSFKLKPIVLGLMSLAVLPVSPMQAFAEEEEIEEILVTGSRIKRTDLEGSSPVAVIDRAKIDNMPVTSVGELVQRLPAITGTTSNQAQGSGAGFISTVTLRGIESSNTLVLVNGRRVVTSNTLNQVDLNSIPFDAVERVEVLKDGASAVYGSDAIAGVVNIIMKKNYEGFQMSGERGASTHGDADSRRIAFTYGNNFDKGNFLVSMASRNVSGWASKDRNITEDANWSSYDNGSNYRSGTSPFPRLVGFGDPLGADVGFTPSFESTPDGDYGLADFVEYNYDVHGYNYHQVTSGANDQRNTTVYASGSYQFTDTLSAFFEYNSFSGWTRGNQAPPGVSTSYYGSFLPVFDIGVEAGQRYNPFDEGGHVSRRFSEYGPRIYSENTDLDRYTFGLEGDLGDWEWDVIFSQQDSRRVWDAGKQPSIRAIDRATRAACGTDADPDCVPIDLFGSHGSVTQEMLDFINVTKPMQINDNSMDSYLLNLAGPVFDLPAGTVQVAAGFEYRKEHAQKVVDVDTQNLDISWGDNSEDTISPTRTVKEIYLETSFPLLADKPFAQSLDLDIAVRRSEYSDINKSSTNPKIGLRWRPNDDFMLRASYSEGFRAPTVDEMYAGTAINYDEITDPCTETPALPGCPADWATDGVPANPELGLNTVTGSNPGLKPEKAENMTIGAVFTPSALDGLSITLDYFRIKQKDVVNASALYTLRQAALGIPKYMEKVTRRENDGHVVLVDASNDNVAGREVAGFDLTINYGFEVGDLGEFNAFWDTTKWTTFDVQDDPGSEVRDNLGFYSDQFGNIPEIRSVVGLDWNKDNISAVYTVELIQGTDDIGTCLNRNADSECTDYHHLAGRALHSFQASYFVEHGIDAKVSFGVDNVTNEEPPHLPSSTNGYDDLTYSARGRFYYLRFSKEF